MSTAYLVAGVRTPIGRYGGALASVRTDDLAAHVVRELTHRLPAVDWAAVDDVVLGCANQAGEDNRNVGRMGALLAGLPVEVPGSTVNRLCASGLDAVITAARAVRGGDADLVIAGGVESMTRAPLVMPKPNAAWSREATVYDSTIGWRFVNPSMKSSYGIDSMPETAQNVADEYGISRADQDAFAHLSQQRAAAAIASGRFKLEIAPITVRQRRTDTVFDTDEHPRETSREELGSLAPIVPDGSITAGNASGVNDGAAAVLVASKAAVRRYGLEPLARITTAASVGVAPRVMGIGPVRAVQKVLSRNGIGIADVDVVELNEAFAAQALAVLRQLRLADDADHVNPNGGAIALGHPLGATGARLALTAAIELAERGAARALATLCVGVGQGTAVLLESV